MSIPNKPYVIDSLPAILGKPVSPEQAHSSGEKGALAAFFPNPTWAKMNIPVCAPGLPVRPHTVGFLPPSPHFFNAALPRGKGCISQTPWSLAQHLCFSPISEGRGVS